MHIRKLFSGTIVAAFLLMSFIPVHAGNPVPDSACHIECEKNYEQWVIKSQTKLRAQRVSKLQLSNLEIASANAGARNEVVTDVQTLEAKFSPNDGGPSRTVTLRLGDPAHNTEMGCWGVLVEILGFDDPYAKTIYGEDWAQAIELAAKIMPIVLEGYVADAEGTLEPSFYERPPHTTDLSELPAEIRQVFSESSESDD